jgi:predicted permease
MMGSWLRRLLYLFQQSRHDAELRDEIEVHRSLRQAHLERQGRAPADASLESQRALGNTLLAREEVREVWLGSWSAWLQDVRYGTRTLAANRGFALVSLLTLALCIGANTAVFSVVYAVVLRPLPYAAPDRLVMIWTDDVRRGLHEEVTSIPTIEDWRAMSRSFTDLAIVSSNPLVLTDGDPERTKGAFVSANVFSVLGVSAALGRVFSSQEESELLDRVVISHRLWQRRFGSDPNVIGRPLTIDGDVNAGKQGPRTVEIVGVMPATFFFPDKTTDVWEPATLYWRWARESSAREFRRWAVVARLGAGATDETAEAELRSIGGQIARLHAAADPQGAGFVPNVVPLSDQLTGVGVKRTLWMLLAAVGLVLVIGCTNVANLTLARGASRQSEFAVRRALGAGRSRIVRQLLAESLLLALIGGSLGLLVARTTLDILVSAAPPNLLRLDEVSMSLPVLAYTLLASVCAAIFFGLLPALRTSDAAPLSVLREQSASSGGSPRAARTRAWLIGLECTLAVVLLSGASLLVKSLLRLHAVPTGFTAENVLVARVALPTDAGGPRQSAATVFSNRQERFRQMAERVAGMPGVRAVGIVDNLLIPGAAGDTITLPGNASSAVAPGQLNAASVSPEFFEALDVPLTAGRRVTRDDLARKIALFQPGAAIGTLPPEPAVVNETFVRRYFAGRNPLGQRFCLGCPQKPYWYEVVGTVGDMRRQSLEREPVAEYFTLIFGAQTAELLIRTTDRPERYAGLTRSAVLDVERGAKVLEISTVDQRLGALSADRRFQASLLTTMAALAMILAAGGIYGLVRYGVAQRTREIGLRLALGADPAAVVRLIVSQGARAPLVGAVIGLAATVALSRTLAHALFGISPTDPSTLAQSALGVAVVIGLACYLPARRAARIDPLVTLRKY